jgi:hypothetical protein
MGYDFSGTETLDMGNGRQLFIYSIDKENELIPLNFKGIDEFFKQLDKMKRKAFNNTMILFDGYNDTTEELHEIPEVRAFVKELFERYPHVLNYVNFELEGHHVLLSSLTDVVTLSGINKMTLEEMDRVYGVGNYPKMQVSMTMPNMQSQRLCNAMLAHGIRLNQTTKAELKVRQFQKIFNK